MLAPFPLARRSRPLTPSARCARPAGARGWTRGERCHGARGATAVRLGAAALGYFGCLFSFREVRKTVSHVPHTHLEVLHIWFLLQHGVQTGSDFLSRDYRTPH